MTRNRLIFFSVLLAGCAPVAGYQEPYADLPLSQAPVRSAYPDVPTPAVVAVLEEGRIAPADYPRQARESRAEGEVAVSLLIRPDGRVGDCRVDRSSGDRSLDYATCRLILDRFLYQHARDSYGNPVEDVAGWVQAWSLGEQR